MPKKGKRRRAAEPPPKQWSKQATAQFAEGRDLLATGPASYPRAAELFQAAADAGHTIASVWLALCYKHGLVEAKSEGECGRLAGIAQDELRALADQGDAAAQHALGEMFNIGLGVPKDQCEAVVWFRKSAEQGNSDGQCELGQAYNDGEGEAWTGTSCSLHGTLIAFGLQVSPRTPKRRWSGGGRPPIQGVRTHSGAWGAHTGMAMPF